MFPLHTEACVKLSLVYSVGAVKDFVQRIVFKMREVLFRQR